MTSPVDIVNQALDQIGATQSGGTVQGINPPIPPNQLAAQVASRLYQQQVDAVFRAAHWNCARLQAPLSLLKAAPGTPENPNGTLLPLPPAPYLYSYGEPADCLKVRFLFTNPNWSTGSVPALTNMGSRTQSIVDTSMPFVPAIDTDAGGNQVRVILTNTRRAQIVYTGRIANPDLWDASLKNAVIATLAAWFVNPVTRNKELLGERVQMAASLIAAARLSDGNEGITSTDHIPDWMQVRSGGEGRYGWTGEGRGYFAGYDAISLPNGQSF